MFESRKELRAELERYKMYYEIVCKKSGITAFEGVSHFQLEKNQIERENIQLKKENGYLKDKLSKLHNNRDM